jgi:hypothetical protein
MMLLADSLDYMIGFLRLLVIGNSGGPTSTQRMPGPKVAFRRFSNRL